MRTNKSTSSVTQMDFTGLNKLKVKIVESGKYFIGRTGPFRKK